MKNPQRQFDREDAVIKTKRKNIPMGDVFIKVPSYDDDLFIQSSCQHSSMRISVEFKIKSMIMIFRNGGRVAKAKMLLQKYGNIGGQGMYLGMKLIPKLSFKKNITPRVVFIDSNNFRGIPCIYSVAMILSNLLLSRMEEYIR